MKRRGAVFGLVAAVLLLGGVVPAWAGPDHVTAGVRVVQYRIPSPGVPEGIAVGADGAIWFSERYTTQVGRVTPTGSFTIRSFPMNNHMSTDITAGPDGAVWFAFPNSVPPYDTGKIGRIAPTGEVTFFTIPWVSDAESITTGPDGNLWFADHVAAALGRLTPTGTFTKFTVPGPQGTYPWQLAAGPDGALWFTDFNGHRIGRMTTDGQTTFSSIPLSDGYPNAIGAGPDGNVWFTLDDEATIGRITPAGAITEFPVSHPDGDYVILGGIATVSQTTLAFTYQDIVTGESRIGRVTTAGVISTMATPTPNSSPLGITAGPGNGIWFTQIGVPSVAGILRGGPSS
jgi:streptogramin lyase